MMGLITTKPPGGRDSRIRCAFFTASIDKGSLGRSRLKQV
jgi:hypothetical protein